MASCFTYPLPHTRYCFTALDSPTSYRGLVSMAAGYASAISKKTRVPQHPRSRALHADTAFTECRHKHPGSLSSAPPHEDQTDRNTSSSCDNSDNGTNGDLFLDGGQNRGEIRISHNRARRPITSLLLNFMGAGDGIEPPAYPDDGQVLPLHHPARS